MRSRRATTAVIAALSLAVAGAGAVVAVTAPAQAAAEPVVLSRGHIDAMEVTFDPATGKPRLLVKDDTELFATGPVFRAPEDVVIAVDDEQAAFEVPAGLAPEYAFLGGPGNVVYLVPEVQDPDLPWPGWSTERLQSTVPSGTTLAAGPDAVELAVTVTGPGAVHTFMSGPVGEVINHHIDTTDGEPELIPVGTNNHVHTSWVFTALGSYTLAVTPTVRTADGGRITGSPSTYTFHVGNPLAPVSTSPPVVTGTPQLGKVLTATSGTWSGAGLTHTYQWLRSGKAIPGATRTTYRPVVADVRRTLAVRVTARGAATATGVATSGARSIRPGAAPHPTTRPKVVGKKRVGRTLQVKRGSWAPAPTGFAVQWRVGGKLLATRSTKLKLTRAHRGKKVTVTVVARRPGHLDGRTTLSAGRVR